MIRTYLYANLKRQFGHLEAESGEFTAAFAETCFATTIRQRGARIIVLSINFRRL